MNNMRRGFTMIELVFVIVIIGILAAVALPRFTGISDDAHVSKLQSFVGTLNRTVGPSVWSGLQRAVPTSNGDVSLATNPAKYRSLGTDASALGADAQLETIPSELIGTGLTLTLATSVLNLTTCAAAVDALGAPTTIPAVGTTGGAGIGGDIADTSLIGTTTYAIGCITGTLANAPRFYLYDVNTDFIITK